MVETKEAKFRLIKFLVLFEMAVRYWYFRDHVGLGFLCKTKLCRLVPVRPLKFTQK